MCVCVVYEVHIVYEVCGYVCVCECMLLCTCTEAKERYQKFYSITLSLTPLRQGFSKESAPRTDARRFKKSSYVCLAITVLGLQIGS